MAAGWKTRYTQAPVVEDERDEQVKALNAAELARLLDEIPETWRLFYAFLAPRQSDTTVWKLDPANNSVTKVVGPVMGRIVVGAGVSTCAPQH